jgi:hypothetical protein
MQHRHMPVGEPSAFVEMTARKCAETVQMRLDMAKQGIGEMNAKQIRQRRISTIEIHARCVGGKQSFLSGEIRNAVVLELPH